MASCFGGVSGVPLMDKIGLMGLSCWLCSGGVSFIKSNREDFPV